MKKLFIFIVLIFTTLTLCARENPFKEAKTVKTMGQATYVKDTRENFTNVQINLPSSARILQSVELHFQNLDGSMDSEKVEIDKKVDWHDMLVLQKEDDINVPVFEEKIVSKKIEPKKIIKKNTMINFKNFISFEMEDKNIYIKTQDRKIRDFLVNNPYKVVLDFEKEISFYTKVYDLNIKNFKSITIGKHDGYYRVVIELDGKYRYSLSKIEDGYLVHLR